MAVEVAVDFGPAEKVLGGFLTGGRVSSEKLIPLLQELQAAYGYLPVEVLRRVSEQTGIPLSRIYGVVTFYAQFYLKPHGKHTVTVCRGTSCHVRGGKKVHQAITSLLGVDDGETTEDMQFSFETVACLGACALSPVMVVDGNYHGKLNPRRAEHILRQLICEETAEVPR